MSFKNYRELFQALLDGKKLSFDGTNEQLFVIMALDGNIYESDGINSVKEEFSFHELGRWSMYQEPTLPCEHWAMMKSFSERILCRICHKELIPTNGWTVAK